MRKKGRFGSVSFSVTRRFEGKIPRFFSKTLDFALLLKRLRDLCGIAGKILKEKRAKKANFRQKSTLFEQKVDLKPKPLDFRAFGIFADR